jgi:hypothetical protein
MDFRNRDDSIRRLEALLDETLHALVDAREQHRPHEVLAALANAHAFASGVLKHPLDADTRRVRVAIEMAEKAIHDYRIPRG